MTIPVQVQAEISRLGFELVDDMRPVESGARWSMCRRCTSTVRQRAARLVREYVVWRASGG